MASFDSILIVRQNVVVVIAIVDVDVAVVVSIILITRECAAASTNSPFIEWKATSHTISSHQSHWINIAWLQEPFVYYYFALLLFVLLLNGARYVRMTDAILIVVILLNVRIASILELECGDVCSCALFAKCIRHSDLFAIVSRCISRAIRLSVWWGQIVTLSVRLTHASITNLSTHLRENSLQNLLIEDMRLKTDIPSTPHWKYRI